MATGYFSRLLNVVTCDGQMKEQMEDSHPYLKQILQILISKIKSLLKGLTFWNIFYHVCIKHASLPPPFTEQMLLLWLKLYLLYLGLGFDPCLLTQGLDEARWISTEVFKIGCRGEPDL